MLREKKMFFINLHLFFSKRFFYSAARTVSKPGSGRRLVELIFNNLLYMEETPVEALKEPLPL